MINATDLAGIPRIIYGIVDRGAYEYDSVPPCPTDLVASDGSYTNKVLITWNAASWVTEYQIFRHTINDSSRADQIGTATSTGYDDTGAVAGTTYYYWVKAVNAGSASSLSTSDSGFLGVVGPLITANGLVGDVYLNNGDPVTIAIQMMNIDPYTETPVDWWVVAFAYTGQWYYINNVFQWASFNGDLASCHPVYQGPLGNVPSTPVLSGVLPSGTYGFWFAVDYPMNGVMNGTAMLFNNVTIVVQ